MALSCSVSMKKVFVEQEFGEEKIERTTEYKDAYFCVTEISGNKDGIVATVCAYADDGKENALFRRQHLFTPSLEPSAGNFIAQAYRHIKTLPEYAEARDC